MTVSTLIKSIIQRPTTTDTPTDVPTGEVLDLDTVDMWGVRSNEGIITIAPDAITARDWADYRFIAGGIGDCGEVLVVHWVNGGWKDA